ncbi:MAG: hypothetical protein KA147_03690 [Bacteroidia bacterium]|nr:hypothetical protein [Bacteroidia bacterium]
MANNRLKLSIEELRDLGILNSERAYKYFLKQQLLTAGDICKEHERFNGDWAHRSEKGTPVKDVATRIYDYCINEIDLQIDLSAGKEKYHKIEPFLDKKLGNEKDKFIQALSQENIYRVWYSLIQLYFNKKNEIELLKKRFLIIDPDYKEYEYWGKEAGKIRVSLHRIKKYARIPDFINILVKADLLGIEDFIFQRSGAVHIVIPKEKDEYLGSGMGLAFINYAIVRLNNNYISLSDILNNPGKDKKIIDDNENVYFLDVSSLDRQYILNLLLDFRKATYSGRNQAKIKLNINKHNENAVIHDLMTYVLNSYKPEYNEKSGIYTLTVKEILPSLSLAIKQIFEKKTNNSFGIDSFKASSWDLKKIIEEEPVYEHLRDRTEEQIKGSLESNKNLWSIGQKYRLVSSLKYGRVNSIGVLLAVLNIKHNCTGLYLDDLCKEIHEAGYDWSDNTLEQNLKKYKEHFQEENGKWFSRENKCI